MEVLVAAVKLDLEIRHAADLAGAGMSVRKNGIPRISVQIKLLGGSELVKIGESVERFIAADRLP